MSDETPAAKKRPELTAYFVADREKAIWIPIGAAWAHSDGEGFNVKLDLMPNAPGRIVLRKPKSEPAQDAEGQEDAE